MLLVQSACPRDYVSLIYFVALVDEGRDVINVQQCGGRIKIIVVRMPIKTNDNFVLQNAFGQLCNRSALVWKFSI